MRSHISFSYPKFFVTERIIIKENAGSAIIGHNDHLQHFGPLIRAMMERWLFKQGPLKKRQNWDVVKKKKFQTSELTEHKTLWRRALCGPWAIYSQETC